MAQRINRGVHKVAKQREQEDAQEFLTFLLDSIHQEQLKLRVMYGTEGESDAAPKTKGGGATPFSVNATRLYRAVQCCCTQQDSVILSMTRPTCSYMDTTLHDNVRRPALFQDQQTGH